jgi:hypothetical protein
LEFGEALDWDDGWRAGLAMRRISEEARLHRLIRDNVIRGFVFDVEESRLKAVRL